MRRIQIANPYIHADEQRAHYRAIILGSSGQITRIVNLTAADDAEALKLSEAMVDGHAVELWDGLRYIEHFPAKD